MSLSPLEREEVAAELKRFASDLNLTDDQKEKLRGALTEAREKIAEYMQQNPNTTKPTSSPRLLQIGKGFVSGSSTS
jgi:anti-sigma regulatory factor (Ser/Thr protein kinase)